MKSQYSKNKFVHATPVENALRNRIAKLDTFERIAILIDTNEMQKLRLQKMPVQYCGTLTEQKLT